MGGPLIHHALVEAQAGGFSSVTIVISPAKWAIRQYFEPDAELVRWLEARGDEQALASVRAVADLAVRLRLEFVEQSSPGGLGEAVLAAARNLGTEPFGVLLPDDVVTSAGHWQSLIALHSKSGAAALCVRNVPPDQVERFGMALYSREGDHLRIHRLVEKPAQGDVASNMAIFGRYLVTPPVVDALRHADRDGHGELQLTAGFAKAAEESPGVVADEFGGEFFDNGTPADYFRSIQRFSPRGS